MLKVKPAPDYPLTRPHTEPKTEEERMQRAKLRDLMMKIRQKVLREEK